LIAIATAQTHLDGYYITAYKGIAQGTTYLALLRDAEALGANAVLNTCFDDALGVDTAYHGAAVVILPLRGTAGRWDRAHRPHAFGCPGSLHGQSANLQFESKETA